MDIMLTQLSDYQPINKVIVHSLEGMLYQVAVIVEGKERLLYTDDHKPLRVYSLSQIRDLLQPLMVKEVVLRQPMVYDEMIGQPASCYVPASEMPLGW
jgi:hypothetical protein